MSLLEYIRGKSNTAQTSPSSNLYCRISSQFTYAPTQLDITLSFQKCSEVRYNIQSLIKLLQSHIVLGHFKKVWKRF